MKLSKIDLYNALSNTTHIRAMVDSVVEVEMIYKTDKASYLVTKDSAIYTDSVTAINGIDQLADIFDEELAKGSIKVKIILVEPKDKKSYYRFELVE